LLWRSRHEITRHYIIIAAFPSAAPALVHLAAACCYLAAKGPLLTLFALEAFILVQWIAMKRIQELEVI
jgi:hypothetical protein